MHSPNSRHTAAEGPWVPEPIIVNETPIPAQTPKPYVLVMLKGFCTEFFSTHAEMNSFAGTCIRKDRPFLCFQFEPESGRYFHIGVVPTIP